MPKTVVVISEDAELLRSMRLLLRSEGYEVQVARDVPQITNLRADRSPDIVLFDLGHPPDLGYKACQQLKALWAQTQVILMTGASLSEADKAMGFQAGVDGFIPRPQEFPEILAYIEERLAPHEKAPTESAALFLRCPECRTAYPVPESRMEEAKKFKCPTCEYVFVPVPDHFVRGRPRGPVARAGAGETILLVEDTEFFRRYVADLLQEAGFRVVAVSDGKEALAAVARERPDLVLTDLLLPGIHGFDLCKQIKTLDATCPIPVIMMTGVYKSTHYQYEGQWKYGADDFIVKPFSPDDLVRKIKNVLVQKGKRRPAWERFAGGTCD